MIDVVWNALDKAGLMPHGVCFLWREDLVYMHVLSDIVITLAYFSLPVFLMMLVRKKPELKQSGVIPLFAAFIMLCGLTHAFSIWVLFVPDYLAQGIVKTMTAIVSLVTAVLVWPLLPKLIAMPSPQELIDANEELRRQIEEREKAEMRSERLAQAIEQMDELVVLFDREERILSGNRAWREINSNIDEQSVIGVKFEDHIRDAVHSGLVPEATGREEEWIAERLAQHRKMDGMANVRFRGGRTFRMTKKRFDDGSTIMVGSDVTKQLELEAAQQQARRMETVGQLTGGIAHDFNNLLAIIIGNLDFMELKTKAQADLVKHIGNARQAAGRGAELTRKLLNFSRQESGPLEPVDANQVIGDLQDLLTKSITSEIDITFDLAAGLPSTKVNAGDLGDVLVNLAINARDAMPKGGSLVVRTENVQIDPDFGDKRLTLKPGGYVLLTVSDSGAGIPEDRIDRIFEPFFTTKEVGKGTGLGLSMVYAFAVRSGGGVSVQSEPGKGATFKLYLPVVEEATVPQEAVDKSVEEQHPLGNETVLVVDDEKDLLDLAATYLRESGYKVLTAGNAAKALELLSSEPSIDLLFSDVIMPGGMDGFELAGKATKLHPALKVVLASGYTGKLEDWRVLSPSACRLLEKPYDLPELAKAVRSILDSGSRAQSEDRNSADAQRELSSGRLVEAI